MIGTTLQKLIDEKGTNVNELSRAIGVSAQTLYSIIKRDNMKIDFDILLKICETLSVDVGVFYKEYIKSSSYQGINDGAASITHDERCVIQKYRSLDTRGKEIVDFVLDKESERCREATIPFPSPAKAKHPRKLSPPVEEVSEGEEGWRQYVGTPIACRGGGVQSATEEDAKQMEKVFNKLFNQPPHGTGKK